MSAREPLENREEGCNIIPGPDPVIAELTRRLFNVEDELFLMKILHSSNQKSGIPTGHNDAYHGGAILDDTRRMIVSVSRDSNHCRDVFITRLTDSTHGSTEVKKNLIPFVASYRHLLFDGKRYVYVTESHIDGGSGRRFGRLDLETLLFEELEPLPEPHKAYAPGLAGCFHDGTVFVGDTTSQLCGYDVEKRLWRNYGMTVPTEAEGRWGRLLSDPRDRRHLYCIGRCTMSNLYRIDLETRSYSILSILPTQVNELDAALVRSCPESDNFVIVARMYDGSWQLYSSKTNTWRALSLWKPFNNNWIRNFLVFSPSTNTFYYHVHESSTWDIVQL